MHAAMKRGLTISWVGALALIGVAGIALVLRQVPDRGTAMQPAAQARIGGAFALIDETGQQVSDRTYRGRWMLVFFGFTFCPDVCPTALNEVALTLRDLGPLAARIQPLFISVDPERDTPSQLAEYTDAFDSRIVGLTGTPAEIAAAARAYGAYYRKVGGGDDYTMDHSAIIYVMNPEGRFVTSFNHMSGADRMVKALRPLLAKS